MEEGIDDPILNSPFQEPKYHFEVTHEGVTGKVLKGRRNSIYYVPVPHIKVRGLNRGLDLPTEQVKENTFINDLRQKVNLWRAQGYPLVTSVTRKLLKFWINPSREKRFFFCQIEAMETIIYLTEAAGRSGDQWIENRIRESNEDANPGLYRIAFKMATGSGKTVVMAMMIAWQALNKFQYRQNRKFTDKFLIVSPGITIKDRLQVLLPSASNNYYDERIILPPGDKEKLGHAKISIINYHSFKLKETSDASRLSKSILSNGGRGDRQFTETPAKMVNRILRGMKSGKGQIVVINDEAHHCYREKPQADEDINKLKGEDKDEAVKRKEYARVWLSGLEAIQKKVGIKAIYDLSATPFFLRGSGYPEGRLFGWVVSDFSLIDAIESGITKVPRVPVMDNANVIPTYRNLYSHIKDALPKKGRRAKEETGEPVLPKELEGALIALYENYEKEFKQWESSGYSDETSPPVFIVVCNNTNVSKIIYDYISGYEEEREGKPIFKAGKLKLLQNNDGGRKEVSPRTILIDSEALDRGAGVLSENFKKQAKVEIHDFKEEYRERFPGSSDEAIKDEVILREIMNTVGKPNKLGEKVRCVVSVSMLTEGWDANTVTHILGVRAFGTQLLCEQVVGRGLRRMSYQTITKTIHLAGEKHTIETFPVEYAEVFGIPFEFLKITGGRNIRKPTPKPYHIKALAEREEFEISFPRVIGYRYDIGDTKLSTNFDEASTLSLSTKELPTYTENAPILGESTEITIAELQKRRLQEVYYKVAKRVLEKYFSAFEEEENFGSSRVKYWLFPQVLSATRHWIDNYVILTDDTFIQMLLITEYAATAAKRIGSAIFTAHQGEKILKPILERYNIEGYSRYTDFFTAKSIIPTKKSHVNHVVSDSGWEIRLIPKLEEMEEVICYVKNEGLGFSIPYEFEGVERKYIPDFIVRLDDGRGVSDPLNIILEITGQRFDEKADKADTVKNNWIPAVNNDGRFGRWAFLEIEDIEDAKNKIRRVQRLLVLDKSSCFI